MRKNYLKLINRIQIKIRINKRKIEKPDKAN